MSTKVLDEDNNLCDYCMLCCDTCDIEECEQCDEFIAIDKDLEGIEFKTE